jgi:hypothetical protein
MKDPLQDADYKSIYRFDRRPVIILLTEHEKDVKMSRESCCPRIFLSTDLPFGRDRASDEKGTER